MRTKATKLQKSATRRATKAVYAKMVAAASAVVIQNRGRQYRSGNPEYVLMSFPHWVTFSRGFPKGEIVEKTLLTNTYKVNAVKLLNWLYTNGYSQYNVLTLVKETRQFERELNSIDKSILGE